MPTKDATLFLWSMIARKARGPLTQAEFAEDLEIGLRTFRSYERGEVIPPIHLRQILSALAWEHRDGSEDE